jgi:hypothetical protein
LALKGSLDNMKPEAVELNIDFFRTAAPPILEVTFEDLGGIHTIVEEAPGSTLADAIATAYVMLTGKAVLNMCRFVDHLKATNLDVANRKISVTVNGI